MSKAAELAKMGEVLTNSQVGGRRNIIINGAMQVAQRATSATSVLASTAVIPACDRWMFEVSGSNTSGRLTVSQSTDTPNGFGNSLKLDVTTADTSIAADEFVSLVQRIEGQNLQQLKKGTSDAETVTLSFFAKGTAKKYACGFYDVDNSRNVHAHFDVTTSWQRFIINFPADTTGAFDNDNAQSAFILFNLHAGTNFSSGTLNTTWQANDNTDRAAGIDSLLSSTDNELYITGVQLEVGSTATPFEHRSKADEINLCLRYYCNTISVYHCDYAGSSSLANFQFPVPMRDSPTYTTFENNGGTGLYDLHHTREPGALAGYAYKASDIQDRVSFSVDAEL